MSHLAHSILLPQLVAVLAHYPCTVALPGLADMSISLVGNYQFDTWRLCMDFTSAQGLKKKLYLLYRPSNRSLTWDFLFVSAGIWSLASITPTESVIWKLLSASTTVMEYSSLSSNSCCLCIGIISILIGIISMLEMPKRLVITWRKILHNACNICMVITHWPPSYRYISNHSLGCNANKNFYSVFVFVIWPDSSPFYLYMELDNNNYYLKPYACSNDAAL